MKFKASKNCFCIWFRNSNQLAETTTEIGNIQCTAVCLFMNREKFQQHLIGKSCSIFKKNPVSCLIEKLNDVKTISEDKQQFLASSKAKRFCFLKIIRIFKIEFSFWLEHRHICVLFLWRLTTKISHKQENYLAWIDRWFNRKPCSL